MTAYRRPSTVSRRAILRGGAALLALPFLDSLPTAQAAGSALPKRVVFMFWPDGAFPELWQPNSTGALTLKPMWSVLEPFKNRLAVISGLNAPYALEKGAPGDSHQAGMGGLLSGRKLHTDEIGNGITLDQHLGKQLGTDTAENCVVLGARPGYASVWNRVSYSAPKSPIDPLKPRAAFDKLFKNLPPPGDDSALAEIKRQNGLSRAVFDAVKDDLNRVKPRLSSADAKKLEEHLSSINELDKKLDVIPTVSSGCQIPDYKSLPAVDENENFPEVIDAQIELATRALACDLTRVVTLQMSGSVSHLKHPWAGVNFVHHGEVSHNKYGNPKSWALDMTSKIAGFYASKLASLLTHLDSVPEGEGTLLDNTLIYFCTDLADGTHKRDNYPVILAGGNGLKGGQHLNFSGRGLNDVLLTVAQAMGVPMASFGDPAYCKGVLPGVLA